jgi:hypothetical protein
MGLAWVWMRGEKLVWGKSGPVKKYIYRAEVGQPTETLDKPGQEKRVR